MFTLLDGRNELYRWDLDRQIAVSDPTITQVHFCNKTDDCSLVVEVKDGKANIPNILLQDAYPIRVYAYCSKYTKVEAIFKVRDRTKPSDYLYSETEVITITELTERAEQALDAAEKALEEAEQILTDTSLRISDDGEGNVIITPSEHDEYMSNYYTKEEVDNAIANIEISGGSIEVTPVVYQYKLPYPLDDGLNLELTSELIEFAERFINGENVILYIYWNGQLFSTHVQNSHTISDGSNIDNLRIQYFNMFAHSKHSTKYEGFQILTNTIILKHNADTNEWLSAIHYYDPDIDSDFLPNYDAVNLLINEATSAIEIPSLDGYATEQYVDDAVANAGGSTECNIPLLPSYEFDIAANEPGMYAIIQGKTDSLNAILDSSMNARIGLSQWVSNGFLAIKDKFVTIWGQENNNLIYYAFDLNSYVDSANDEIYEAPILDMNTYNGLVTSVDIPDYATKGYVDEMLGVIENGTY